MNKFKMVSFLSLTLFLIYVIPALAQRTASKDGAMETDKAETTSSPTQPISAPPAPGPIAIPAPTHPSYIAAYRAKMPNASCGLSPTCSQLIGLSSINYDPSSGASSAQTNYIQTTTTPLNETIADLDLAVNFPYIHLASLEHHNNFNKYILKYYLFSSPNSTPSITTVPLTPPPPYNINLFDYHTDIAVAPNNDAYIAVSWFQNDIWPQHSIHIYLIKISAGNVSYYPVFQYVIPSINTWWNNWRDSDITVTLGNNNTTAYIGTVLPGPNSVADYNFYEFSFNLTTNTLTSQQIISGNDLVIPSPTNWSGGEAQPILVKGFDSVNGIDLATTRGKNGFVPTQYTTLYTSSGGAMSTSYSAQHYAVDITVQDIPVPLKPLFRLFISQVFPFPPTLGLFLENSSDGGITWTPSLIYHAVDPITGTSNFPQWPSLQKKFNTFPLLTAVAEQQNSATSLFDILKIIIVDQFPPILNPFSPPLIQVPTTFNGQEVQNISDLEFEEYQ